MGGTRIIRVGSLKKKKMMGIHNNNMMMMIVSGHSPANIPDPVPTSITTLSLNTSGLPMIAAW